MKAIVFDRYGGADELHLAELAEPRAGEGELKIAVSGASINPIDWKIRSGARKDAFPVRFPAVPGRDVSGTVVEVGKGVTRFAVGDRVLGLVWNSYADFVVAKQDAFAPLPAGLDPIDAAAIPLAGLTGVQLVEEHARVEHDEIVLITGALGAVGRFALHAARSRGARVIAGVRRKQLAEAQQLGAMSVVALDDEAALDSLPALDAICDTVGGETLQKLVRKVKSGGSIASTLSVPRDAHRRDIDTIHMMTHGDAARLEACAKAVAAGELRLPIEKRFPLAQAAQAQAMAEAGGVGKIVLVI